MKHFAIIVRRRQEGWRLVRLGGSPYRKALWWASRDAMLAYLRKL